MHRERVESSSIASVGYDEELSVLEVEFHHGGVYRYGMVPSSVYRDLVTADSLGRFFNASVRNRYPEQKVG